MSIERMISKNLNPNRWILDTELFGVDNTRGVQPKYIICISPNITKNSLKTRKVKVVGGIPHTLGHLQKDTGEW